MSALTLTGNTPSMTSIELVEFINAERKEAATADKPYVELRHDSFVDKLKTHPQIDAPKFIGAQKYGNNNTRTIYSLPKREACLMAMSYSLDMQGKVWDRMTALEQDLAPKLPQTFAQALRLAAEQQEVIERQQAELLASAPKVKFAEAIRNLDETCTFEEMAKTLSRGRNKLIAALKGAKVLQASRMPYQKYIDLGYFRVVETNPYEDSKGNTNPTFATRITGKGQVWLQKNIEVIEAKAAEIKKGKA